MARGGLTTSHPWCPLRANKVAFGLDRLPCLWFSFMTEYSLDAYRAAVALRHLRAECDSDWTRTYWAELLTDTPVTRTAPSYGSYANAGRSNATTNQAQLAGCPSVRVIQLRSTWALPAGTLGPNYQQLLSVTFSATTTHPVVVAESRGQNGNTGAAQTTPIHVAPNSSNGM